MTIRAEIIALQEKTCSEVEECAATIKKLVSYNWALNRGMIGFNAVVYIKLNGNNEVTDIKVISSTDSNKFKLSVLKAVKRSSPYTMLNGLSKTDRILFNEIRFNFSPECNLCF